MSIVLTVADFGNNSTPIPTTVIVVTYMRSGSSLTGDILQQSPGAFYIYEPLRELEKLANQPGSNLMFVNGTVRYLKQFNNVLFYLFFNSENLCFTNYKTSR